MQEHQSPLSSINRIIALALVGVTPLFFLPITQEFFVTNKFYLLGFAVLLMTVMLGIQLITAKKLVWESRPMDNAALLFLVACGLSTLISSPNKIVALLSANFGLALIFFLTALYFYLSRSLAQAHAPHHENRAENTLMMLFGIPAIVLSITAIVFFFQPFKQMTLPFQLQFLQNPSFTPIGNQLDLILFLGFAFVFAIVRVMKHLNSEDTRREGKQIGLGSVVAVLSFVAVLLTTYMLFKPDAANPTATPTLPLPPYRLAWYAAVEILKNPVSALFGVGMANFSTIFTAVKDLLYNQSPLWQIQSFLLSRSLILHVLTETGVLGLVAFSLMLLGLIKAVMSTRFTDTTKALMGYLLIVCLLFPPSFIVMFLLYVFAAFVMSGMASEEKRTIINLDALMPARIALVILTFVVVVGVGYFFGRSFVSEYYFKQSLDAISRNNGQDLYNYQRMAIVANPYIDRFRVSFSQTNLLIANNLASKKKEEITQSDRETIAQAIQAAIAEAKAAVSLNPTRASNWDNLAGIYRNVLNIAQGADVWTVSSYQRAVLLDPENPVYRLSLGGVYYSLGNYDDAGRMFEQAVSLKSDWPNAHYNLAWAAYQKADYQRAASEMQNVISLLNPVRDQADIARAQKDLDSFKAKIPKEGEKTATPAATQPKKLSLPTPPVATFSPKIQLPKEASPEAK